MHRFIPLALVTLAFWVHADDAVYSVTVTAGKSPAPVAILNAELPKDLTGDAFMLVDGAGKALDAQVDHGQLYFYVLDLAADETRTYTLRPSAAPTAGSVAIAETDEGAEVKIDGALFTKYQTKNGPKPYLWPIIGPTGALMTRSFPMDKKVKGELRDHIHHRGMWFGFDKVNSVDFWAETPTSGKCIHDSFTSIKSGPVFGEIAAKVNWQSRKGEPVAHDTRSYRFYRVPGARVVDFTIALASANGPLQLGDSKEGVFAIRVNEQMKVERKDNPGSIINSEGQKDGEAWGKRATWVDYFGKLEDKPVGIAIFDHAGNFRHPTYWHVRTYGLFAANPFGISHFTGDKAQNGAHEVPAGQSYNATYRVYFHPGNTDEAKVKEWYEAYAHPPTVTITKK